MDVSEIPRIYPEGKEIYKRFSDLLSVSANEVCFIPDNAQNLDIESLIESHIHAIRPIILQEPYNQITIDFLKKPFRVEKAPDGVVPPDKNDLVGTLYEALQEFKIEFMPEENMYDELYEWAIGLTKCDEVAAYILAPCFETDKVPDFRGGFLLWSLGLRRSYWIKDEDSNSGVVLYQGEKT